MWQSNSRPSRSVTRSHRSGNLRFSFAPSQLHLVLACVVSFAMAQVSSAQSVRIEGSAAGHPINKAAAEEFRKAGRGQVAFGIAGDSGGLGKFCGREIDIVNTSRPIQKVEIDACAKGKVDFIEVPIAFDAVTVIVNPRNQFANSLSVDELRKVWEAAAQGRITKWSQVRAGWPDVPIKLLGPDRVSEGSRYFTDAILGASRPSRQDYMTSSEDSIIVQGIARDRNALGYVSLAYYLANRSKVRVVPISSSGTAVAPSVESVARGAYQPLSRPLFLYVSVKSLDKPAVREFVEFYLANGGRLARAANYVPLAENTYQLGLSRLKSRTAGTVWGGGVPVGLTIEALHKKHAML